jgi:branched-chain amino acid transport system substrate-binding protein
LAFEKKYNTKPDAFAALAYDATRLLAEAVRKSGRDRVAVREFLASLSVASPFAGVTGPIYFNSDGDPIGMGFHVAQVIDGQLVSGAATTEKR